jgi:hypothetical protein
MQPEAAPPARARQRPRRGTPSALTAPIIAETIIAAIITLAALYLFFNGSFVSSYEALDVDFSINWTAAHALRNGDIPYGKTTLAELAAQLGGPTDLIYGQLYTSYIQPPTSALHILPLTELGWRHASQTYLFLNHAFLFCAVGITLVTVRPTLPLRWVVAGVVVIVALYSQLYMSFSLGQVDATILLLLSLAFWGYTRDKPALTGGAIACAMAIKIVPGVLLLYLLWRREYRPVVWACAVGGALLVASAAYVGIDVYRAFFEDTLPALLKGSTQYSNISFGAMVARLNSPESFGGLPAVFSLDEPPTGTKARLMSSALTLVTLAVAAVVLGIKRRTPEEKRREVPVFEFYFVIAVALLISSVTWETYVIWLMPVFFAAFLAPERYLPSGRVRWLLLAGFVVAYLCLNYPGDLYLLAPGFSPAQSLYHIDRVPGIWAENKLQFYHNHFDAVIYLRLPALLFLTGLLATLTAWRRLRPEDFAIEPSARQA